jgi:UDP-3-O-[3-hydroxymyristoyl] glucosamine N-acyltransferase
MELTAAEIAKHVGGEVIGDAKLILRGIAQAENAKPGDLVFAEQGDYFARAEASQASAILVPASQGSSTKTLIRVPNVRVGFARALALFFPEPAFPPGVHSSAQIARSAIIDATAHIGPFCVVGEGVRIGPRCVLEADDHIGADCVLGEDTRLFPRVVLYPRTQVGNRVRIHAGAAIGADGFGYVFDQGRHLKVPQIGNVIIQDDVEIGANSAVDRAALGSTVIGKGTKIDNLVQVGHNVTLGEHCILCGQVGIAGSTKVGSYVTMAGQVGVAGHLSIGSKATLGAQSGVMHNVPDGETWLFSPAQPDRQVKRMLIAMQRLPELLRRVNELEKRLAEKEGSARAD